MRKSSPTHTNRDKPLEDYTEDEIREMFLDMFFWIAENRPDWLQEAIERKKRMLGPQQANRRLKIKNNPKQQ